MGWESEEWAAEENRGASFASGACFSLMGRLGYGPYRPPEDRCNELWRRFMKGHLGTLQLLVNGKRVPFSIEDCPLCLKSFASRPEESSILHLGRPIMPKKLCQPSGISGGLSRSHGLQAGHGAPAPPQSQPPGHGRSR